jgi:hypothetical protein
MDFLGDGVKGNLSLGKFPGAGQDSTAELKADEFVFELDESKIAQLASMGQKFKAVRSCCRD